MTYKNLKYEVENGIAVIKFNRPEKLNALNAETIDALARAVDDAGSDGEVKGIIITGEGEKAFIAGADIKELSESTPLGGKQTSLRGQEVFGKIETMGKPVIAAINGFALGGGLELALVCHIRVAAENAKLGQPEVGLGIIPGYGGTQRLSRLIGTSRALELILGGHMIGAERAEQIGLVNKVVPEGEALDASKEMMEKIISNAPLALKGAIEAVQSGMNMTLEEGLRHEASLFGLLCTTEDMKEGLGAFLDKRKAEFKGK